MYKYAIRTLNKRLFELKNEQKELSDKICYKILTPEQGLFASSEVQSRIFDLEDAIGILEDIAKDIEKDKSNGEL